MEPIYTKTNKLNNIYVLVHPACLSLNHWASRDSRHRAAGWAHRGPTECIGVPFASRTADRATKPFNLGYEVATLNLRDFQRIPVFSAIKRMTHSLCSRRRSEAGPHLLRVYSLASARSSDSGRSYWLLLLLPLPSMHLSLGRVAPSQFLAKKCLTIAHLQGDACPAIANL